jgi:hypothetical protein
MTSCSIVSCAEAVELQRAPRPSVVIAIAIRVILRFIFMTAPL